MGVLRYLYGYPINTGDYSRLQEIFGEYFPYGLDKFDKKIQPNGHCYISKKKQKSENRLIYQIFSHKFNLSGFAITKILKYHLEEKFNFVILTNIVNIELDKYEDVNFDDDLTSEIGSELSMIDVFIDEFISYVKSLDPSRFKNLIITDEDCEGEKENNVNPGYHITIGVDLCIPATFYEVGSIIVLDDPLCENQGELKQMTRDLKQILPNLGEPSYIIVGHK